MSNKYFFLFLVLLLFTGVNYAQITSAKSGAWNADTTWVGGIIPGGSDNVVISSGHVVTLNSTTAQCNNLSLSGTCRFAIDGSITGITINGNLTVNTGGKFRVESRTIATPASPYVQHTATIYGNITNTGTGIIDLRGGSNSTGTAGGVLLTFAGSGNSTISLLSTTYLSGTEEFNGININKTGGAKVILASGNLFMSNNSTTGPVVLTFQSGIIETGNNIWVHLATSSVCIVGGNSLRYVSGCLGRGMTTSGGSERKFDIGDDNGYRPIFIRSYSGGIATGHYTFAKIITGNANTGSSVFSGGIDSVSRIRYYQIGYSKGGVAGTADSMGFQQFTPTYNSDDNVVQGTTGLMVGYSKDSRNTWINAGPTNHVVDLLNPPTEIQSSTLPAPVYMTNNVVMQVALAYGTSTALVPDLPNVSYGPSPMMTFDMWKAPSATPTPLVVYIHGGGMSSGSKSDISQSLITALLAKGISVMSINYRLTPEVIIPQHYMDAARAIQYARFHASELNINPDKIGAGGSSAGACISFWLGFHNDLADPLNPDSVLRMSTRLNAVCSWSGQTTMDRRVAASWIGPMVLQFSYFVTGAVFGLTPETLETPEAYALYEMASPVNHLDATDCPVWMYYSNVDTPATSSEAIHHINFGRNLKRMMDSLSLPNSLLDPTYVGSVTGSAADFYFQYLNNPLPVEMNIFSAKAEGKKVKLHWITQSEIDNSGWEIERCIRTTNGKSNWLKIGFVKGHGNRNISYEYDFIDDNPLINGTYLYRLKQIDTDGKYKYSFEAEVNIAAPTEFSMDQNYPNPFNPTTIIKYSLDKTEMVSLKVYDILGNLITTLVNEVREPGFYQNEFSSLSNKLSSGVYIYQLRSGERNITHKMILMK